MKVRLFKYLILNLIGISLLYSLNLDYVSIKGKQYIPLSRLKEVNSRISVEWSPLLLTAEIKYQKKIIRVQAGTLFYVSDNESFPLSNPPVFYKNELYLPGELVEEIFSELSVPVNFRFEKKNLQVKEDKVKKKSGLEFIMIDPGHGGKDPGAFGYGNVREKDITYKTSRYVYEYLKKNLPGVKIYMSRYSDTFIPLEKRSDLANEKINGNSMGLFISIHCNSSLQRSVNGFEIFYLSQSSDSEEDRRVMMRENEIISNEDPEISMIEGYLMNSQILSESKMLARQVQRSLMTHLDGLVSSRGIRKADFRVLRKSLMPAILIETGYISNENESRVLQMEQYRAQLAQGLTEAIKNFMKYRPGL